MSLFTIQSLNIPPNRIPSQTNCLKYKPEYPVFKPIISNLSVQSSFARQYSLVYIFGYNFFPNGTTYVNFGQYQNIPITYYGSNNIAFSVPIQAKPGNYDVNVVNIYNGNFSLPVNQTNSGYRMNTTAKIATTATVSQTFCLNLIRSRFLSSSWQ